MSFLFLRFSLIARFLWGDFLLNFSWFHTSPVWNLIATGLERETQKNAWENNTPTEDDSSDYSLL